MQKSDKEGELIKLDVKPQLEIGYLNGDPNEKLLKNNTKFG